MERFIFTPPCNDDYIAASEYYSYIENRIYNEQRLAQALSDMKVFSESSVEYITEAKMGDKIKSRWNRFIQFIKGLIAKFTDSMSKILYNQKEYLEKNKDVILHRKPKDISFSYDGDYEEGIKRLNNMELPIFNYQSHGNALKQDGDGPILNIIMNGKTGWKYDEGKSDNLAGQFKDYYLAKDKGTKNGTLADLNFTDMYNFCYNSDKVKSLVDKDLNHLESSTKAINDAINKEINARDQQQQQATGGGSGETTENQNQTKEEAGYYIEADGDQNQQGDNANKAGSNSSNLKLNTNPTANMGSYNNRDKPDDTTKAGNALLAAQDNNSTKDIQKITDKWINVCKAIISAKLTAVQEISKCYMQLIRTHIRSYAGQKANKNNTKEQDQATNYDNSEEQQTKGQKVKNKVKNAAKKAKAATQGNKAAKETT